MEDKEKKTIMLILLELVLGVVAAKATSSVTDQMGSFLSDARKKVHKTKKQIMKDMMSVLGMAVAAVFLLVAATLFMIDVLEVERSLAYLLTAIVIASLSIFIRR